MQWNDISLEGRWKLIRWLNKQTRMHRSICMSRIIATAPNESKLFKMTRFIDKCYAIKALRATQEAPGIVAPDLESIVQPESSCEAVESFYIEGSE